MVVVNLGRYESALRDAFEHCFKEFRCSQRGKSGTFTEGRCSEISQRKGKMKEASGALDDVAEEVF
jgi:hypothetical protein